MVILTLFPAPFHNKWPLSRFSLTASLRVVSYKTPAIIQHYGHFPSFWCRGGVSLPVLCLELLTFPGNCQEWECRKCSFILIVHSSVCRFTTILMYWGSLKFPKNLEITSLNKFYAWSSTKVMVLSNARSFISYWICRLLKTPSFSAASERSETFLARNKNKAYFYLKL